MEQFGPTSPSAGNSNIKSSQAVIQPASFTGSLLFEPSTGLISVSNAAPEGNYTITATVTDHRDATTQRTVDLRVLVEKIFKDGFETGS